MKMSRLLSHRADDILFNTSVYRKQKNFCACTRCVCVYLAVTFLEYWKRKTASITYYWDCYDFEEAEARSHCS